MPVFYPTELPEGGVTFSVPNRLYHYTTQEGLLGILETGELWCSDLRYLDDRAEVQHGIDLLAEMLPSGRVADTGLEAFKIRLREAAELFLSQRVFVFCFSVNGDLLSQWRAYCPRPGGVAVGLSGPKLRHLARKNNFTLAKCIYGEEDQREELRRIIAKIVEAYQEDRAAGAPESSDLEKEHANEFKRRLFPRIVRFKHPSFKEEKEWRLSSPALPYEEESVCYRPGPTTLRPYVRFNLEADWLDQHPIEEVIVGPSPDQDLAVRAVIQLLRKYGIHARVTASDTPYRSW